MKLGKTLYVTNEKDWRKWLVKNHKKKSEIWLIYYKKASGKLRILYNDAVDEALCYGWIDSTVKSIDEERFAQRFTPRRKRSGLSQMNRERIRKLIAQKKMTKAGLKAIAHVFNPSRDTVKKPVIPPEVSQALKTKPKAWQNFQRFPDSYQRMRLAYIESQKKHNKQFYRAAIRNLVKMSAQNKRFGLIRE